MECIVTRNEQEKDYHRTEELVRNAFWNVYRPGCTEHYILHCLRDNPVFVQELDLVLERSGEIIGQIAYTYSKINCSDGREVPTMTFGPVCIAPNYQRRGYGKQLIQSSMILAKEHGAGAIAITGNFEFYKKIGFVQAKEKGILYAEDPSANYFLIKELVPGYLDGVSGSFRDPEGYSVFERDPIGFEQYEKSFPVREKLKLPGQLF